MNHSYNKFLESRSESEFENYLNMILRSIRRTNLRVKSVEIKVDEPDKDISYFISNGLTCSYYYIVTYGNTSVDPSGNEVFTNSQVFNFSVPRMINNVIIWEGKIKSPMTTLISNEEIRFTENRFKIERYKYLDYDPGEYTFYDSNGERQVIPVDQLDTIDPQYRTLTRFQTKKFSIKLDLPTPSNNLVLDSKLARLIINKMQGVSDKFDDHILDRQAETPQTALFKHLYSRTTRKEVKLDILRNINKGKLYASPLNKAIKAFFIGRSNSLQAVQTPNRVNTLNFESNINRIYLDKFGSNTTRYNRSLADLIDPIRTPENANVNRINEMNVCTVVNPEGTFSIRVYDSKLNPKVVEYIDYYDTIVVSNESYDYIKDQFILDDQGLVTIKYRGKNSKVDPKSLSNLDYLIDAKVDEKLSITTRMIPMVNHTDSIRVGMGDQMVNQAVELQNPENPIVSSGHSIDEDNPLSVKAMKSGEVESIVNNVIRVKNDDGSVSEYTYPTIQSQNNLNIKRIPKVKVGDTIKEGSLIAAPRNIDREFRPGLNCLTAFTYGGNTIEDGVIVSEAVRDRFSHVSIIDLEYEVGMNTVISAVAPLGTKLKPDDVIVHSETLFNRGAFAKVSREFRNRRKSAAPQYLDSSFKCPKDLQECYLTDIKVFQLSDKVNPNNKAILDNVMLNHTQSRRNLYGNIDVHEDYIESELTNNYETKPRKDSQFIIKVRILSVNRLKRGDKLTSRFGSKGLVSEIRPESEMPQLEDGRRVEIILNPDSTVGRKIASQLLEIQLPWISQKVYQHVSTLIDDPSNYEEIRELLSDIINPNLWKYSYDELVEYHNKVKNGIYQVVTGSFSKDLTKKVIEYSNKYDISLEGEYLYYNGIRTEERVIVGLFYMMKLYHLPEFTNKVTSDNMIGSGPVLGGRFRPTGQSIGEMEFWAYSANNLLELMDYYMTDTREMEQSLMMTDFYLLGYQLKDSNKS